MNRKMRRASHSEGLRMSKKEFNKFEDVTVVSHEKHRILSPTSTFFPHQVWQNNHYIVQVFFNQKRKGKFYTKAMVKRTDGATLSAWEDLYRIKNEIFGEEVEAVQFLPPKSELTDVANLYWFFIEMPTNI